MRRQLRKFARFFALPAIVACSLTAAAAQDKDFGAFAEKELQHRSMQLFGIQDPVAASAFGPYTQFDSVNAVDVAKGLSVSLVTAANHPDSDMIALWPSDSNPTHLIVAVENGTSAPGVQVVNIATGAANTILTGLSTADPIRRTPWGTIVVAEEAGSNGGLYEILDPLSLIGSPVTITNRNVGTTTNPAKVVKRKAIGALSFEGLGIFPNGTLYYGDELRPDIGKPGGAIYKFIPFAPWIPGNSPITTLANSPFALGNIYGMRLGTNSGNTDYGQGTEIGKGAWVPIDAITFSDANSNIILRNAQTALKLTGYYRPEDLEVDPIALAEDKVRFCVANTGRTTHNSNSVVENAGQYGEVICVTDEPNPSATTGRQPFAVRFIQGDPDASHFDNLAFQPGTGRLVILEDGATVSNAGSGDVPRGNDIWLALQDGEDRDVQSDGLIRILSLKDTDSETTGFIFDASGETAYVNLQHRATGVGALLKITGFQVK